jgi:acetyl esterase
MHSIMKLILLVSTLYFVSQVSGEADIDVCRNDTRLTEDARRVVMELNSVKKFLNAADNNKAFESKLLELYNFDRLVIKEYLVRSVYDDQQIPVTTYVPKGKKPSRHINVFAHGGAFQFGSRISSQPTIGYLAELTNTIWVSVEYRLSPEFQYPAAFHDCSSVTQWVLGNKQTLFGSSKKAKVGVAGEGAGGNLAAAVAHELKNKLDFQILVHPKVDLTCSSSSHQEFKDACFSSPAKAQLAASAYTGVHQLNSSLVSPLFNTDFNNQPKALIILAELDTLFEEGKQYFKKLKEANTPSRLYVFNGNVHGFFMNSVPIKKDFKKAAGYVADFLKRV